jgi:hypothetical protein
MREGLRPDPPKRNLDCELGVYLAEEALMAVGMLLDAYAEAGDATSSPRERVAAVVVIVVDDARIDAATLVADPNLPEGRCAGTWLHPGVIDVRGSVVLELSDVLPDPAA